jgi:ABC-type sugar transport system permease subunit
MVVTSFAFAHVLKNSQSHRRDCRRLSLGAILHFGHSSRPFLQHVDQLWRGLITSILISLDMDPVSFTSDGIWPYVAFRPTLWLGLGYNTLVMYAGLINIPKDYYEAARIDGASPWQCLWSITIPNMKNYFVLIIINLVTVNLQMMEIPYIMTGGGPLNRTLTPVLYLFNSFRDPNRPQNVTIAGAILVMLLISTVNVIVFRFVRSRRSEDA